IGPCAELISAERRPIGYLAGELPRTGVRRESVKESVTPPVVRLHGQIPPRQNCGYLGRGERHRAGVCAKACAGRRAHCHRRCRSGGRYGEDGGANGPPRACLQMRRVLGGLGQGTLAGQVNKRFGRCDILINCPGIFPNQPFDEITFADWRRVQAINLDSVFLMSAAFAPSMKQRRWGRMVNMASSTLGSVVSGLVHYMASKAGIVGITRALA